MCLGVPTRMVRGVYSGLRTSQAVSAQFDRDPATYLGVRGPELSDIPGGPFSPEAPKRRRSLVSVCLSVCLSVPLLREASSHPHRQACGLSGASARRQRPRGTLGVCLLECDGGLLYAQVLAMVSVAEWPGWLVLVLVLVSGHGLGPMRDGGCM